MKITLLSLCAQITNTVGVRAIAACLRTRGHRVRIVFLPKLSDYKGAMEFLGDRYEDSVVEQLVPLCHDSDFIGISTMTTAALRAEQLTIALRQKLDIPIIWGGIHPTSCPEQSLEHADIICLGEGEDTIVEFADKYDRGQDVTATEGMWFRSAQGHIKKNPMRQLQANLDSYPAPDHCQDDHYVLFGGSIVPLTSDILRLFSQAFYPVYFYGKHGYGTVTSRGCPHKCAYCYNNAIKSLYPGQQYLRWRSVAHVMEELVRARALYPFVDFIVFFDDLFFARSLKNIEHFCHEYDQKIGLPFYCCADPLTLTGQKLAILVRSGLTCVQMGIQTAGPATQAMYNRQRVTNAVVGSAIAAIHAHKDRLTACYDFIVDNPYEDRESRRQTLKFMLDIPRPHQANIQSLVLYPGTELYERARKDGLALADKATIYRKHFQMREANYFNLIALLSQNVALPRPIVDVLISRMLVAAADSRVGRSLAAALFRMAKVIHGKVVPRQANPYLAELISAGGY